jgi:hypothetical protein
VSNVIAGTLNFPGVKFAPLMFSTRFDLPSRRPCGQNIKACTTSPRPFSFYSPEIHPMGAGEHKARFAGVIGAQSPEIGFYVR